MKGKLFVIRIPRFKSVFYSGVKLGQAIKITKPELPHL